MYLVRKKHPNKDKEKTGQQVRFCKIDGNEVFFYFIKP